MKNTSRLFALGTLASLLLLTACGGGEDAADMEVTIPDAPGAAIETIGKELEKGNGGILWQAMPASYQADLTAVAQLAGAKVDAELYNKGFAMVGRLAAVADKQKEFILNSNLGGPRPPEQIASIEAAWPSIIGFVETVAQSPIASAEGLQSFDGKEFSETTISSLIGYSEDLAALSGEPDPLQFGSVEVIESTETTAQLELKTPDGAVAAENFTKVEGRWVPTEMASGWSASMAQAKAQLESLTAEDMAKNKPQILGVLTMLDGILTQIEAAETQAQFDQSLQGAMMPLMGLFMMQQGMGQ